MNSAYVYLQLYRLFDNITPTASDCGQLCNKACCMGDDGGMYLFPGEDAVYKLLNPDWIRIEDSDFEYTFNGKKKNVKIAFCKGECDRYQRPLACRIFPLTPYIKNGNLEIITDPRSRSICPLGNYFKLEDYDRNFVKNVKSTFIMLSKNPEIRAFLKAYSKYLDTFLQFYPPEN